MIKRLISKIIVMSIVTILSVPAITALAENFRSDAVTISNSGVSFIKSVENFSPSEYQKSSKWYIGYGTPCAQGSYPEGISQSDAEALLLQSLQASISSVNSYIEKYKIVLTQTQYDALISFTYNLGPQWMDPSNRISSFMINGLTKYSETDLVNAIGVWCHSGKVINNQLVVRRLAEANLFINGDYSRQIENKYSYIIFDAGKGSVDHDIYFYKYHQSYEVLPTPVRTGYVFDGWYSSNSKLISTKDIADQNMTVSARWVDQPTMPSNTSSFTDVSKEDWYFTYVSDLSKLKVVGGYPDGSFRPNSSVSYAEALKLILLAAGYSEQPSNGTNWADGYLNFAISKGFIDASDVSNLNGMINRQLIAKMASKALKLNLVKDKSPFSDTSDQYVVSLYKNGIVEGNLVNGTLVFMPNSSIKRSEISAIIWRINNLKTTQSNNTEPAATSEPTDSNGTSGNTPSTPDHTNQIQYGTKWIDILSGVPVNSYDNSCFYTEGSMMRYRSASVITKIGIDVSSFQGTIDWTKVKNAGIDFVMIRVGYRGYGNGSMNKDSCFDANISGALNAGLKVGVYFFSQAITSEEAIEEANFVLSQIKGYDISYPVVYDWETVGSSTARTANMDTQTLCQCANAFSATIRSAGYSPMVYFNVSLGYLKYDLSQLLDTQFWLAQYTAAPSFYYDFTMWQYTSKGKVDGISGNVDMDIVFEK